MAQNNGRTPAWARRRATEQRRTRKMLQRWADYPQRWITAGSVDASALEAHGRMQVIPEPQVWISPALRVIA